MKVAYINGEYLPPQEARISILDRGFNYGDGVFTTVQVAAGGPVLLAWHLERLQRDAAALFIPLPPLEELEAACSGVISISGMREGVVKIVVSRGPGARGLSMITPAPTIVITVAEPPAPRSPLKAVTVPDERGPLAAHKTLNCLPNILALHRAEMLGCQEAVFVRGGLLMEATISNLIGVVDGEPLTPSLDGRVLGGIARRALLNAGAVREGDLPEDTPGPLYCVNAVRGLEAVAVLNGRVLTLDHLVEHRLKEAL